MPNSPFKVTITIVPIILSFSLGIYFIAQSSWAHKEFIYFKRSLNKTLKPTLSVKNSVEIPVKFTLPTTHQVTTPLQEETQITAQKETINSAVFMTKAAPPKIIQITGKHISVIEILPQTEINRQAPLPITLLKPIQVKTPKTPLSSPPIKEQATNHAANGFKAYNQRHYRRAITEFLLYLEENSSSSNANIHSQIAYAYKLIGERKHAATHFKKAMDLSPSFSKQSRKEIQQLNNIFSFDHTVVWREKTKFSEIFGNNMITSGSFSRFSFKPIFLNSSTNLETKIFARLMSSLDKNMGKSYQGSLGISVKPLKKTNLIISAERLFKIGEFSRNDWMIRASYSASRHLGLIEQPVLAYSLYLDLSVIGVKSFDYSFTASAMTGYALPLSGNITLRPEIMARMIISRDKYYKSHHFEISSGISSRFYYGQSKYKTYNNYITISAHYNLKAFGNSLTSSGFSLAASFHF